MINSGYMRYLVGIDDTDNAESRGTGYKARMLAERLNMEANFTVKSVSRHQLYIHPDIRYTSKNSSACIDITVDNSDVLTNISAEFMRDNCELGSDGGLCIVSYKDAPEDLLNWGLDAKKKVLNIHDAWKFASRHTIFLEGFTGDKGGVIGALAAVALRKSGSDGRIIFLNGKIKLRELKGIYLIRSIKNLTRIDDVLDLNKKKLNENERISLHDWVRPVIKNNKIILLAEKVYNNPDYEWTCADKTLVRSISD